MRHVRQQALKPLPQVGLPRLQNLEGVGDQRQPDPGAVVAQHLFDRQQLKKLHRLAGPHQFQRPGAATGGLPRRHQIQIYVVRNPAHARIQRRAAFGQEAGIRNDRVAAARHVLGLLPLEIGRRHAVVVKGPGAVVVVHVGVEDRF